MASSPLGSPPPHDPSPETTPPPTPDAAPPPPLPSSPPSPANSDSHSNSNSNSKTLTLALALTEETAASTPPSQRRPPGSALTIAKVLSGEDGAILDAAAAVTAAKSVAAGFGGGKVGLSKRWLLGVPDIVRRREVKKAELGFRVSAFVFALVSVSVMAADNTPGWDGDSFRRYLEYRYLLAASVIAFAYSGFQLIAELYYVIAGKHIIRRPWGLCFNLSMDQILAYLLLSASSAAISQNDVRVSRFGGDDFTKLINASSSVAFLAFVALAGSSIISAYNAFSSIP